MCFNFKTIALTIFSIIFSIQAWSESKIEDQLNMTEYPYYAKTFQDSVQSTNGFGDYLNEKGVNYRGLALAAFFNNHSTGAIPNKTGGQAIFINALDFDLEKLLSISNTSIHTEFVFFPWHYPNDNAIEFGTYASSLLGGDQYPSHAPGFDPWMSLLTIEQTLMNGRLNYEVGKTNLQRYFFTPTCGLDFFCTDPIMKWNTGVPDASTGSVGGRVKYQLEGPWNVEIGAQQMREYNALIEHRGWHVFDTSAGEGTFFAGALRYHAKENQKAPDLYELNYYYADASVSNPLDSQHTHRGSSGVLFKFNKTLSASDQDVNVKWFGALGKTFDTYKPVGYSATQGLSFANILSEPLIGSITLDQITTKFMYIHLNEKTLLAQRDLRQSLGGTAEMTNPNEFRFELSTTLGLTKNIKFQPVIEYILHPDSTMSRTSANIPKSGWLVGAMLGITLGN